MRISSTQPAAGIRTTFVAVAMATLLPSVSVAGPIFVPGRLDDGKFVADKEAKAPLCSIEYSTVTIRVEGDLAQTKIQETIVGPKEAVDSVCVIPLPKLAEPGGILVAAGLPNQDHAVLPSARFLAAPEAQKLYESIAEATGSVKILSLTGRPAIVIPAFKLRDKVEIVVEFAQRVEAPDGVHWLECPMPAVDWAKGPVARLSVAVEVTSREPLRAMFSPTHTVGVERKTPHEAVARVKADNHRGTDDFRLCWVADRDDLGLRALAYRGEGDEDGYFMLVGNPTGSDAEAALIAKDVVFVLDTSGSMRGEKIEQARAAIEYCLARLNPGDRFNIVTFGTEVESFRPEAVDRSEKNVAAARDFIEEVVAKGRTNISGALAKALEGKPQQDRPRITIFLTDGTPTAGELAPEKIVEAVKRVKPCPTRIFVMGVGHDVNAHLLDKLAEATDGSSEYVDPKEDIDAKVAALYDRLSHPVLTNVELAFGDLKPHSVYPEKLPALFKGSEVMVFGRYREGGKRTFTVSGMLAGKPATYTCAADLPAKPSGPANEFIAPLWAARKIGYLLQEIRLHGENDELVAEVVRLSKKFGIVTEYTEFIAFASGEVSDEKAMSEARRRMNMANTQQAGQWAFNQARNDKQLQQRMVATKDGNTYLDRRGRVVSNDNLRQIGSQAFYLRDGQWVDARDAGGRKTRVVKLFSPEYKELLRANADFARAQQLGWAMSINVGGERVVVEKDGVQKSEELRKMQQVEENLPDPQELQQQNLRQNVRGLQQMQQAPTQQLQMNQMLQIPRNLMPNQQLQRNRQPEQAPHATTGPAPVGR
jgi:Ca-activated chloride channel family protein